MKITEKQDMSKKNNLTVPENTSNTSRPKKRSLGSPVNTDLELTNKSVKMNTTHFDDFDLSKSLNENSPPSKSKTGNYKNRKNRLLSGVSSKNIRNFEGKNIANWKF